MVRKVDLLVIVYIVLLIWPEMSDGMLFLNQAKSYKSRNSNCPCLRGNRKYGRSCSCLTRSNLIPRNYGQSRGGYSSSAVYSQLLQKQPDQLQQPSSVPHYQSYPPPPQFSVVRNNKGQPTILIPTKYIAQQPQQAPQVVTNNRPQERPYQALYEVQGPTQQSSYVAPSQTVYQVQAQQQAPQTYSFGSNSYQPFPFQFSSLPKPQIDLPYPKSPSPPTVASLDPLFPILPSIGASQGSQEVLRSKEPPQDDPMDVAHLPQVYSLQKPQVASTGPPTKVIQGGQLEESKNCVCNLIQTLDGKITYHCKCKEPSAPSKLMENALAALLKNAQQANPSFKNVDSSQQTIVKPSMVMPTTPMPAQEPLTTTEMFTLPTLPAPKPISSIDMSQFKFSDYNLPSNVSLAQEPVLPSDIPVTLPCITALIDGRPYCACEEDYIQCGENLCCHKKFLQTSKPKPSEKSDKALEMFKEVLRRINSHLKTNKLVRKSIKT